MSPRQPTDLAASVRQRLLNIARVRPEEFQRVLTRYGVERLLYRLSRTPDGAQLVLKGAMLFVVWEGAPHRPTRDVDFLGYGDSAPGAVAAVFREACTVAVEPDGLALDPATVRAEAIRDRQEYGGVRVTLVAALGSARIPLQVDVGFGDAVTPAAEWATFPALLPDIPAPRIRAYPADTVVAEKFQAMVALGVANTRLKDFYDLWVLAGTRPFDGVVLARAIGATFNRRGTPLPPGRPLARSDAFTRDRETARSKRSGARSCRAPAWKGRLLTCRPSRSGLARSCCRPPTRCASTGHSGCVGRRPTGGRRVSVTGGVNARPRTWPWKSAPLRWLWLVWRELPQLWQPAAMCLTATVSAALGWLVLRPAGLVWPTHPDRRIASEYRMLPTVFLFPVCLGLGLRTFNALRVSYTSTPVLPPRVLLQYALATAAVHVAVSLLVCFMALMVGMAAGDWLDTYRRRRWWRVLAARELCRTTKLYAESADSHAPLPSVAALRALARAVRFVERGFGDAVRGIPDPLTHNVRDFGYTIGDTMRAVAVPLLTAPPMERAALVQTLDGWIAALIAGTWDRLVDDTIARRPTRLWPQWLRRAGVQLRRLVWGTAAAAIGAFVWKLLRTPASTVPQIAQSAAALLSVLVALAVALKVFDRSSS